MMAFLHKSKFPMINIAIIITIANQNCFLLWSDVFIFGTINYLGHGISLCPVRFPILRSSTAQGLTVEGDSVKEISLWGLASLSCGSKAKSNSPCNFEESSYVGRIFLPVPFMKMSTSCLLISVAPIKNFESDFLKK